MTYLIALPDPSIFTIRLTSNAKTLKYLHLQYLIALLEELLIKQHFWYQDGGGEYLLVVDVDHSSSVCVVSSELVCESLEHDAALYKIIQLHCVHVRAIKHLDTELAKLRRSVINQNISQGVQRSYCRGGLRLTTGSAPGY